MSEPSTVSLAANMWRRWNKAAVAIELGANWVANLSFSVTLVLGVVLGLAVFEGDGKMVAVLSAPLLALLVRTAARGVYVSRSFRAVATSMRETLVPNLVYDISNGQLFDLAATRSVLASGMILRVIENEGEVCIEAEEGPVWFPGGDSWGGDAGF